MICRKEIKVNTVDTLGLQIAKIKERSELRDQSAAIALQIEELQKRISRLITQRVIINSEIDAISNDLLLLAGDR